MRRKEGKETRKERGEKIVQYLSNSGVYEIIGETIEANSYACKGEEKDVRERE